MDIGEIKRKTLPVLRRHNATKAGIFGSAARGKMGRGSDIDILVEIKDRISLIDFVGIEQELARRLGRKVDLVEYKAVHPLLKRRILGEEVRIL